MAIDSTTNSMLLNTIVILKKNINPNSGLYAGKLGRSKVELVLSYGSQFSEFIFIFSGSEF
jgi:hypothetical protein